MKFSAMSPAGAYAPTTHAPPGGNFRCRSFSQGNLESEFVRYYKFRFAQSKLNADFHLGRRGAAFPQDTG